MSTRALPANGSRALHLVDIENLLGTANPGRGDVNTIAPQYDSIADVQPGDHVVVASSHHCALTVWFEWDAAARRLVRSGPDGADNALLGVIEDEEPATRYDRVVIGSGDGIFAEPAARLQAAGVEVTVVTRPSALSRRLWLAARDVRYVGETPMPNNVIALRRAA